MSDDAPPLWVSLLSYAAAAGVAIASAVYAVISNHS